MRGLWGRAVKVTRVGSHGALAPRGVVVAVRSFLPYELQPVRRKRESCPSAMDNLPPEILANIFNAMRDMSADFYHM